MRVLLILLALFALGWANYRESPALKLPPPGTTFGAVR